MVSAAARRPDLKLALIKIAFGEQATLDNVTVRQVVRRVLAWD
jgi:hypothetical protein